MSYLQNNRPGLRDLTNRTFQAKDRMVTRSTAKMVQEQPSLPQIQPSYQESDSKYDIDLPDKHDPLAVSDYVQEIYTYLKELEVRFSAPTDYLDRQKEITAQMRMIVVDWLADVHDRFHLQHETFFLAVNYLDRFLSKKQVAKNKLQLVALGSLFVAAKVEESFAPYLRDLIQVTSAPFTPEQFIKLENVMLKTLEYNMFATSSFAFLRRFTKIAQVDRTHKYTAHYLIEISLLDSSYLEHRYSEIAAAALKAAFEIHGVRSWPEALSRYSGFSEAQITPIAQKLVDSVRKLSKMRVKAVTKKYSSESYHRIATTVADRLNIV
ncbi:hypothetical protein GEMRC1_008215 [Eukaryota sp. GEM-RC1]